MQYSGYYQNQGIDQVCRHLNFLIFRYFMMKLAKTFGNRCRSTVWWLKSDYIFVSLFTVFWLQYHLWLCRPVSLYRMNMIGSVTSFATNLQRIIALKQLTKLVLLWKTCTQELEWQFILLIWYQNGLRECGTKSCFLSFKNLFKGKKNFSFVWLSNY